MRWHRGAIFAADIDADDFVDETSAMVLRELEQENLRRAHRYRKD